MKLDRVIELLVKFGFTPDYITEILSSYDPHSGFERIKTELFMKWVEMGEPSELKEDYDRINRIRLKSINRLSKKDDQAEEKTLDMPPKITPEDFRRLSSMIAGDINSACDESVQQFLDFLSDEQKAFIFGVVNKKKCEGCGE